MPATWKPKKKLFPNDLEILAYFSWLSFIFFIFKNMLPNY